MSSGNKDMQLEKIYAIVSEKMNMEKLLPTDDIRKRLELQKIQKFEQDLKVLATDGLEIAREFTKNKIYFILTEMEEDINRGNIDDTIKQYHINYFKNIYSDDNINLINDDVDKEIEDYFQRYSISIYDGYEKKLSKLAQIIYQELYGYSILDELVFESLFNEVAANRYNFIWIQFKGIKRKIPNAKFRFSTEDYYNKIVEDRMTATADTEMNAGEAMINATLLNGFRVSAARPPLSRYHIVSVRLFIYKDLSEEERVKSKFLNDKIEKIMKTLIKKGRRGVAIIGEMGSGKTTAADEIVISNLDDNLSVGLAENVHELNISHNHINKNVIEFQYSSSYTPTQIIEMFFRFNRDIVILGEVRNALEAFEMIKAMLRQAKGSLFTFHSSSVRRMIHDLRQLLMQTGYYTDYREASFDAADAIDLVFHIKLDRKTGMRYIYKISEINAYDNDFSYKIRDLFVYDKERSVYLVNKNGISQEQIVNCLEYEMTSEDVELIKNLFVIRDDEQDMYTYMEDGV